MAWPGVGGNVGGKFVLTDCIYNNCKHLGYFGCGGAGYNLFIGIMGGSSRMNNCEKFLYIYDGRTPGIGDRISTDFTGLIIPKAAAIIETYQGIAGIVAARCAALSEWDNRSRQHRDCQHRRPYNRPRWYRKYAV